jgi:hypothetical protein
MMINLFNQLKKNKIQFKNLFILNLFYLSFFSLPAIENLQIIITESPNFSIVSAQTEYQIYIPAKNAPEIPLQSFFFEIPANQKIKTIEIQPKHAKEIQLSKLLRPALSAKPLSMLNKQEIRIADSEWYQKAQFPETWLHDFGSGKWKNKQIGWVTLPVFIYKPLENSILYPPEFSITVHLENGAKISSGFSRNEQDFMPRAKTESQTYLLILPEAFQTAYQQLIEWRRITGYKIQVKTVESIATEYQGIDLQDKIRNCIKEYEENEQVDYVTLGAGASFIPHRLVFAFDCEYGAYADENDIPSDMYYSCLDGNWDANGNGIYGEEEDETDYFPEVFVGRIPANTTQEVENYSSRLIHYEKGLAENYQKAAGFSEELWADSQSELCQQFIYQQYFPEHYQIEFLFGENNTQANAYQILNQNQNLVQHTGHAGKTVLSLEIGNITLNNLNLLHNDYGGLFYSIGCWPAAFDYNCIGANLVLNAAQGFLGFVGNSRYGWGAPSAAGFGFSEFYQKEFFKTFFWNDFHTLGSLNTMQKIPFIPYFSGTSVYKWVAYQLNALGDAAWHVSRENPKDFSYSLTELDGNYTLQITNSNVPIGNVVVTIGNQQFRTDSQGEVQFLAANETVHLYKYGYKYQSFTLEDIEIVPFIELETQISESYIQGDAILLERSLHNRTNQAYPIQFQYFYNSEEMKVYVEQNPFEIDENSFIELGDVVVKIKSLSESSQLSNGDILYLQENVINSSDNSLITSRVYKFTISAPNLQIIRCVYGEQLANSDTPITISIQNLGDSPVNGFTVTFAVSDQEISFGKNQIIYNEILAPNEIAFFDNTLHRSYNYSYSLNTFLQFIISTRHNGNNYDFYTNTASNNGQIALFQDYPNGIPWHLENYWERVHTYSYEGDYSLSCRPQEIGLYEMKSPAFTYLPNTTIEFMYKYKMPMYGNDGVFFILEYDDKEEILLFLGAGGALPKNPYIEGDWQLYQLKLDELLSDAPPMGTLMKLKLIFQYAEVIPGFNDYATMDEIGIFIDNLSIYSPFPELDMEEQIPAKFDFFIYPNPINRNQILYMVFRLPKATAIEVSLFNVKGQKVAEISTQYLARGERKVTWKVENNMATGVYFLKAKTHERTVVRKILLVK